MIDDALLYRLLEGMEAISALIVSMEDTCDEPQKLVSPLRAVAREIGDIDGLAEQLLEQIKESEATA